SRDAFDELTMWDQVARGGGRSILVGVPPSYPPRRMNGLSVGCFLTPDPETDVYTYPPELAELIRSLVGRYDVDVEDFRTDDKGRLLRDIQEMTRKRFEVVRHLVTHEPWDYFQVVEIGLDRIQHGFWKHHDPDHRLHDPASPWKHVVRDYYRYLDREIGSVLELLDEDTVVAVVSDHGARALDGGFCVNEWLVRHGWLTLRERPSGPTPLERCEVDWSRTRAWSTGGYYGRIFLNVRGREPEGVVDPSEYEDVRSALAAELTLVSDPDGRLLDTRAFRPEEVYRSAKGIPPDLIVHFGDLAWRAIGGVGYDDVYVEENDTGPDDCNHAQYGAFVLAAPRGLPSGPTVHAHLLDIAPTLLELAGYELAPGMQGRSLAGRRAAPPPAGGDAPGRPGGDDDAVVTERLRGLGYIA
ncbi:MAG: alkaline phosphatase family protein, partial [Gemmatimonadota bacterium]